MPYSNKVVSLGSAEKEKNHRPKEEKEQKGTKVQKANPKSTQLEKLLALSLLVGVLKSKREGKSLRGVAVRVASGVTKARIVGVESHEVEKGVSRNKLECFSKRAKRREKNTSCIHCRAASVVNMSVALGAVVLPLEGKDVGATFKSATGNLMKACGYQLLRLRCGSNF
eukprot:640280-Amphidinium_carterae.3